MKKTAAIVPVERIWRCILLMRNQKIILDRDLAVLYDVETKALNQAVKRNIKRFPSDFMFQLTKAEKKQLVTNCDLKLGRQAIQALCFYRAGSFDQGSVEPR